MRACTYLRMIRMVRIISYVHSTASVVYHRSYKEKRDPSVRVLFFFFLTLKPIKIRKFWFIMRILLNQVLNLYED